MMTDANDSLICNYCEHAAMECEPTPMNTSSFAINLSMSGFSFANNVNRETTIFFGGNGAGVCFCGERVPV